MSFSFNFTSQLNDALLDGGLSGLFNNAANPSYAAIYDETDTALFTVVFAQPAATLVDHTLRFTQGESAGDLIFVSGLATHFSLYTGDSLLVGSGDVGEVGSGAAMILTGTNSTQLYAGGRAILDSLQITLAIG